MKQNFRSFLASLFMALFGYGIAGTALAADDAHRHGHQHEGTAAVELRLNDGERWNMDEHTRTMFSKMEQTFFQADHSNLANLNALGTQLDAQLDELINGCTMQGEAHQQLHLFLTPYLSAVKDMTDAKDYDGARDSAIRLKGQLESYKRYFK